jgi:outer membrane protein TolC
VIEEVRLSHEALVAHQQNLRRVREELIPVQQRRRQQAESAYRLGQADVTRLFLAEQDLRAAQARSLDIEREMSIALLRLRRAVGGVAAERDVGTKKAPEKRE